MSKSEFDQEIPQSHNQRHPGKEPQKDIQANNKNQQTMEATINSESTATKLTTALKFGYHESCVQPRKILPS